MLTYRVDLGSSLLTPGVQYQGDGDFFGHLAAALGICRPSFLGKTVESAWVRNTFWHQNFEEGYCALEGGVQSRVSS